MGTVCQKVAGYEYPFRGRAVRSVSRVYQPSAADSARRERSLRSYFTALAASSAWLDGLPSWHTPSCWSYITTDRLITQNELAAMNRFAPFPDFCAACSIRPLPFGIPATRTKSLESWPTTYLRLPLQRSRGRAAWRTRPSMPTAWRSRKLAERFLPRVFRPRVRVVSRFHGRFEPPGACRPEKHLQTRGLRESISADSFPAGESRAPRGVPSVRL